MSRVIGYLLATGQLSETEMDELQALMDAVRAKSITQSVATNDLQIALEQLRAAIDAILEGLR